MLHDVGPYREDLPGAEDYELFLRMSRRSTLSGAARSAYSCEYSLTGLTVTGRRRQQQERLKLQLRYFDYRLHIASTGWPGRFCPWWFRIAPCCGGSLHIRVDDGSMVSVIIPTLNGAVTSQIS